jgi:hypothetical protein
LLIDRAQGGPEGSMDKVLLSRIPGADLREAMLDLQTLRRDDVSGKLSKDDKYILDRLTGEMAKRFTVAREAREKRANDYAWMSAEDLNTELSENINAPKTIPFFGGDSSIRIALQRQLGLLPKSHVEALLRDNVTIRAVHECEPFGANHPGAPGMQPAGVFFGGTGEIQVADDITLPDGTKRHLSQRDATLRHEIGHAIDRITRLSEDPEFIAAVDEGVNKMTPEEYEAAAYWLGEKYALGGFQNPRMGEILKREMRRKETWAEMYSYAYDDSADGYTAFGGLSGFRLAMLFGHARAVMRSRLGAFMSDRTLDHVRRMAA